MNKNITDKHKLSAKLSGGTSDDLLYTKVKATILDLIGGKAPTTLTDVGCGRGGFINYLMPDWNQTNVLGVDIYDHNAGNRSFDFKQQNLNDISWKNLPASSVVTAIEVIEHLENPRSFFRSLAKIMDNSYGIITTPNIESYFSLLNYAIKGYFQGFGPRNYPAHITPLSSYQLKCIIAEIEELELVDVVYSDQLRVIGSWRYLQSYLPFLKGKRWSDNTLVIVRSVGLQ